MPSKKRLNGGHFSGAKVGLSRRPKCREVEVQTDAEFGALLGSLSALNAGESAGGDRGVGDSAVLARRQNVLMMQFKKISEQNREMRAVVAKYEPIPNLLQSIKAHYETTFKNISDDLVTLLFDQQNRETKLKDYLGKQKDFAQRLLEVKDEKIKAKEERNKALKAERELLNESLALHREALELEQRKVQVAVKEQWNALNEADDIREKMEDKLFLAANQWCSTCLTRERVQEGLTDQIAQKLHYIEEQRTQLQLKDTEIAEKIRINQILISDLAKVRGQLKDKTFADKSYRAELTKRQTQLSQAQTELHQLRGAVPPNSESSALSSLSQQSADEATAPTVSSASTIHQQPNPNILTPPEEETTRTSTDDTLPCTNITTTTTAQRMNGNGQQQQNQQKLVKKNTPNSLGNCGNKGIVQQNNVKAKRPAPAAGNNAEAAPQTVVSSKRPCIVPAATCSGGSANNSSSSCTSSIIVVDKLGAAVSTTERFFRSPPLRSNESVNPMASARLMTNTLDGGGVAHKQQLVSHVRSYLNSPVPVVDRCSMPSSANAAVEGIGARSWRPTTAEYQPSMLAQRPQGSFSAQLLRHQQMQKSPIHQSPPVGLPSVTKATSPTSSHPPFFFQSNNIGASGSANNTTNLSLRKCAGATIDDFYDGPPRAMNISGRAPPPVDGSSAVTSSTWRQGGPDKFFMNRPTETQQRNLMFGQQRMLRDRIEQEIRSGVAAPHSSAAVASVSSGAAALPPMYARQQQNFPPPRPAAQIPQPPGRMFYSFANNNNINNQHPFRVAGGGTLPWHAHSSGTFPPCATQQQSRHYPTTTQFFNR